MLWTLALAAPFDVQTLDLRTSTLRLVGQRPGEPRRFLDLPAHVVATNAGIFHDPQTPVGLWVQEGRVLAPLNRSEGEGNFFLKPNGVFWVDAAGAHVGPTERYPATPTTRIATQSGPMLVLDGQLHPAFRVDSPSTKIRSAVCVSDPWTVHLALSRRPVNFHSFATFLLNELHCDNALYLDGTISGLTGANTPNNVYAGFLVGQKRSTETRWLDGDVVLHRSRSRQSAAIALATGSTWTHIGIVRILDGDPWVLEAVQPVKLTPLPVWRARGEPGSFAARRWAEPVWTDKALERLDKLQAAWLLGRPYDLRFEPGDEQLYCSELVRDAFLKAALVEVAPLRAMGSYQVSDPGLRAAMTKRRGILPMQQRVVAPSDIADAAGMRAIDPH